MDRVSLDKILTLFTTIPKKNRQESDYKNIELFIERISGGHAPSGCMDKKLLEGEAVLQMLSLLDQLKELRIRPDLL